MEKQQIDPQEEARQAALKAEAYRSGLGHLQLKLGMLDPDSPIEVQFEELADYNKIPDLETIKRGETQLTEGYMRDFFEEQVAKYFQEHPQAYEILGKKNRESHGGLRRSRSKVSPFER